MFEIELGMVPLIWFPLSKARLSIPSLPKSRRSSPEIRLFRRSRCIKLDILVSDAGIVPEMRLSATFNTINLLSLPMPAGIGPESLFPIRSKIRRNGSDVMQLGISSEMPFQSAMMMLESRRFAARCLFNLLLLLSKLLIFFVEVEWDEINAAWGQACLLLHTMAQYFRPKFLYRIKIIPMGSYPRIMDSNNNTYELFGPVNLFWSTRYDKAMTLFLTCLKDFAEFAHSKDQENNIPPEKCFKLPYKIENDKVENYSITQSFNKQENWTKALKYTLCNLKWALYWFVGSSNFQPPSAMLLSPSATAVGSFYTKHTAEPKSEARNSSNH